MKIAYALESLSDHFELVAHLGVVALKSVQVRPAFQCGSIFSEVRVEPQREGLREPARLMRMRG